MSDQPKTAWALAMRRLEKPPLSIFAELFGGIVAEEEVALYWTGETRVSRSDAGALQSTVDMSSNPARAFRFDSEAEARLVLKTFPLPAGFAPVEIQAKS